MIIVYVQTVVMFRPGAANPNRETNSLPGESSTIQYYYHYSSSYFQLIALILFLFT